MGGPQALGSTARSHGGGFWWCLGGAVLGALGLASYFTGTTHLTSVTVGLPPMVPNTALALLLIGAAGAARQRVDAAPILYNASVVASLVVLAIGAGTLVEYALTVDLRIDNVFVGLSGTSATRPSPPTAIALTCLACAILLLDVRANARPRPADPFVLAAALTAFTGLTGIILGAAPLFRLPRAPLIGISLPTAVSLLLTSTGLLLARPAAGVVALMRSPGPGGLLLRRLTLPVIVAPLIIGFVTIQVSDAHGIKNAEVPVAILAAAMTAVSLSLLVLHALPMNRAHDALEASRARLTDLVAQAPDGIFVADLDGRYTDVNEAGCRLLGRTREEIVGKTIVDLIPRDEVERLWQSKDVMLDGGIHVAEWHLLRKDGRYIPVEVSAGILPDGRWQGFVRDIGERKRVAAGQRFLAEMGTALAGTLDSEQTLARIADLAVQHLADFCLVDLADDDRGMRRVKVASRDAAAARFNDVLADVPVDRSRPDTMRRDVRDPFAVALYSSTDLAAMARSDSHRRSLAEMGVRSAMCIPLVAGENILGVITLLSADPSRIYSPDDLVLARELAQHAALAIENARLYRAAQRAIQARDDVLGIVAHDLRDPLAIILVEASLLRKSAAVQSGQDNAEAIERAARRMNRLIQDLLDVSRSEARQLPVDRTRLSTAKVVAEAVDRHQAAASAVSIELRAGIERELPEIWADGYRLFQAFDNLIGNALKFTPPGGSITIGADPHGVDVRFRVTDTGCGMAAEEAVHVFDRFWQARAAKRAGAGLGLSIVKAIVEAHGGRIWVETALGHGTTFFFTVPAVQQVDGAPVAPSDSHDACVS